MTYKVEFIAQAYEDFKKLDNSIKKQVAKKIDKLNNNPFLGEPLKEKAGIDLSGYYKLYVCNKKYRIVYKIINEKIEVIEIWGIGRRDKEEIYRLVLNRIKQIYK